MDTSDMEVLAWRLFEESNDAVFLLEPDTTAIWQANPAAQRLTGLRWRDLRQRHLDQLIVSDCPDQTSRMLAAVRETGFFHSQEEYFLCCADAPRLPINISVSRVHTPRRDLGLVVARDISERKRAEHAVRKFNQQLNQQVASQTEQLRVVNRQLTDEIALRKTAQEKLQQANQQLREAIRQLERAQQQAIRRERLHALEQIAGGVAHDINNSLSGVATYARLMLGNKDLNSQQREWAEGIRIAANDIAGTVGRLRQFYGDPPDPSHESVDLISLAREAIQLTKPKWHDESLRRGKTITVLVQEESSPDIVGDRDALRSVLSNLIFNAVDAVNVSGTVTIRVAQQSSLGLIEVTDTGAGMSDQQRNRCLEPFYTTKSEGTGLGLSVCHGIVKAHGGQMEIDSSVGSGTTIRLFVPLARTCDCSGTTNDSSAPRADDAKSSLKGKAVLYVDDNESARGSTAALLGSLGLEIDTAEDGPTGLSMFREKNYDALITDMTMPRMDGLQLTAEIKRIDPTVPVLVISGWLKIDTSETEQDIAPDGILGKPLECDQLESQLSDLLLRKSA